MEENFDLACDGHDTCYKDCDRTKSDCDREFYGRILDKCLTMSQWNPFRYDCIKIATIYYIAVHFGGKSSWKSGQVEGKCSCQ